MRPEILSNKIHARELLTQGSLIELVSVKILGEADDIATLETLLNPWPGLADRVGLLQVLIAQAIDRAQTGREGILRLDQRAFLRDPVASHGQFQRPQRDP